jgi:putative transposase
MSKSSYIARSRGVSRLYAHLVLVTKYRADAISPEILFRLQELSVELCQKWQSDCIEANGEEDHLHVIFRYAPQMQLSKFVNNFKAVTSRKIRSEYSDYLRQFYWDWSKGFWSESYSLDSVGFAPLDILKKYVENQGRDCLTTLRSVSQLSHPDSHSVE